MGWDLLETEKGWEGVSREGRGENLQWSLLTNCQQYASPSLFGASDRANWVRRVDKKRKVRLELGFVLLLSRVEIERPSLCEVAWKMEMECESEAREDVR